MDLDVSKKVRTAIKAKLTELGVHVDEELPDYIMILIANRRSKSQIEEDLSLFLSDNTVPFSNWLHQVLKKLQEVTTTAAPPVTSSSSERKPSSSTDERRPSDSSKPSSKSSSRTDVRVEESKKFSEGSSSTVSSTRDQVSSSKRRHSEDVDEGTKASLKSSVQKKVRTGDEEKVTQSSASSNRSPIRLVRKEIHVERDPEPVQSKERKQSQSPVNRKRAISPIRSVLPEVGRDRSQSRSPVRRERSPHSPRKRRTSTQEEDRTRGARRRSRSSSPTSRARRSLRSLVAVVKRHNEQRDESIQRRKEQTVASVVQVAPPPKREVPDERGVNKLLVRALADAQRSIVSQKAPSSAATNSAEKKFPEKPKTEDVRREQNLQTRNAKRKEAEEGNKKSVKDRLGFRSRQEQSGRDAYQAQKAESSEDEEYVPTVDDSFKTIVINVAGTKTKGRMVTLESANKMPEGTKYRPARDRPSEKENVNRLSIDLKDESESSDDGEDRRAKSADSDKKTSVSERRPQVSSEENSNASDAKSSETHEDIRIEEYEEVEDDDDDDDDYDEYEVVLQDKHDTTLPVPDEDSIAMVDSPHSVERPALQSKIVKVASQGQGSPSLRPAVSAATQPMDTQFIVTVDEYEKEGLRGYPEEMDVLPPVQGITTMALRNRMMQQKYLPASFEPLAPASFSFNRALGSGPITGAAVSSTNCKYWPQCQFKDKCIYPHPKCKFGASCTKPDCPYKHDYAPPPKVAKPEPVDAGGRVQCKFFPKCHSMSCPFFHPTPCRFGVGCTDPKCFNFHPGPTIAQQRKIRPSMHNPMFRGSAFPTANLLRWKAPAAPTEAKVENTTA